jgi:uncharacterized membrane protein
MVRVVKKATEGTVPTPASTKVPIKGKAINAGTRVIVPSKAEPTVARKRDCLLTKLAISVGGKNVRIRPIAKIIEKMLMAIPFPILSAIFKAFFVLAPSFLKDMKRKTRVINHKIIVNISTFIALLLSFWCWCFYNNDF